MDLLAVAFLNCLPFFIRICISTWPAFAVPYLTCFCTRALIAWIRMGVSMIILSALLETILSALPVQVIVS